MSKSSTTKQDKPNKSMPVFSAAAIKRAKAAKVSDRLLDAIKYIQAQGKTQ
jgi:hypothetical protein